MKVIIIVEPKSISRKQKCGNYPNPNALFCKIAFSLSSCTLHHQSELSVHWSLCQLWPSPFSMHLQGKFSFILNERAWVLDFYTYCIKVRKWSGRVFARAFKILHSQYFQSKMNNSQNAGILNKMTGFLLGIVVTSMPHSRKNLNMKLMHVVAPNLGKSMLFIYYKNVFLPLLKNRTKKNKSEKKKTEHERNIIDNLVWQKVTLTSEVWTAALMVHYFDVSIILK